MSADIIKLARAQNIPAPKFAKPDDQAAQRSRILGLTIGVGWPRVTDTKVPRPLKDSMANVVEAIDALGFR